MSDSVATALEMKRNMEQHAARLQAAFMQALREEDMAAIARKLIEQAREGDRTSARLVLKYGLSHFKVGSRTGGLSGYDASKPAGRASAPSAAPTAEQLRATLQLKAEAQQALHDEIVGRSPPRPGPATGRGMPPGGGR